MTSLGTIVRTVGRELVSGDTLDVAAMMAFYAMLAIFPMLVFVTSVSLLVLDPTIVREGVLLASKTTPPSVRDLVLTRLDALVHASTAGFAFFGAAFALWGASRGATGMMTALVAIHRKRESRSWLRRQAIALVVTLVVAILIVGALALLFVGPFVGHAIADRIGLGRAFDVGWSVARWIGAGVLVLIVLAILYKFLSDDEEPFRVFTPGALCAVTIWLGLSALFDVYLRHFGSYDATYGALGGMIVFLTWLWLTNVAVLLGAQINQAIADLARRPIDRRRSSSAGSSHNAHAPRSSHA